MLWLPAGRASSPRQPSSSIRHAHNNHYHPACSPWCRLAVVGTSPTQPLTAAEAPTRCCRRARARRTCMLQQCSQLWRTCSTATTAPSWRMARLARVRPPCMTSICCTGALHSCQAPNPSARQQHALSTSMCAALGMQRHRGTAVSMRSLQCRPCSSPAYGAAEAPEAALKDAACCRAAQARPTR